MQRKAWVKFAVAGGLAAAACAGGATLEARTVCVTARQRSTVRLETGLVVTPFAVPVGVPVATVLPQQVLYAFRVADAAGASVAGGMAAPIATRPADAPTDSAAHAAARAQRLPAVDLVARACVTCHGGPAPRGGVSLEGELADALRLRAIAQVISGRMPPERRLEAAELGQIVHELSRPSAASSRESFGETGAAESGEAP